MNVEQHKLRVTRGIEERKSLWTALIVDIGGIAGLMLNMDSVVKIILIILGVILGNVILDSMRDTSKVISESIRSMEKE